MGGAGENMDVSAFAGDLDLITVFDDFNHVIQAVVPNVASGDAATNFWEDCGWATAYVGAPTGAFISMNDPNGGQMPYDSCITMVPGTVEDTGFNMQLDLINTPLKISAANTFSTMAGRHNFPHIWIDETAAGVTTLDNQTFVFACRIGLRADTTVTGVGDWDGKVYIGWAEAGDVAVMTVTGVDMSTPIITQAETGPLVGFCIPEDGSINGICQRTASEAYVEGTNFTALTAAGGVDGTVANGVTTAGDTMWFDLALRMDIVDNSETANGSTSFYYRQVTTGADLGPWTTHGTALANQTPANDVGLVPTIEVINGGTADRDCELYLDWWAFGKTRPSTLSR